MTNASRITVIGAGFGGLSAIRELRKRDRAARITLIAPRAELHYLPGIIWIPSGLRKREQLVVPLGPFLKRMDVQFHAAEVTGLSVDNRTVLGRTSQATFKVELICIVDAISRGSLVYRTPERNVLLPSMRLLHWVKRLFEWNYLRAYR